MALLAGPTGAIHLKRSLKVLLFWGKITQNLANSDIICSFSYGLIIFFSIIWQNTGGSITAASRIVPGIIY